MKKKKLQKSHATLPFNYILKVTLYDDKKGKKRRTYIEEDQKYSSERLCMLTTYTST